MRIQFKMEGGLAYFPGLSQPVTIDTDRLFEEEARELARLVYAARFFELPGEAGSPQRGGADYRRYTITIEDGGQEHTVQLVDPVTEPHLQALLANVRAKALRAAQMRHHERPADRSKEM